MTFSVLHAGTKITLKYERRREMRNVPKRHPKREVMNVL